MKTVIVIAGTAAVLALTGCSSSSSETTTSPTPVQTSAVASPTETAASPMASEIGPIMVAPDETEVSATVGRSINFDVGAKPGNWDIQSSDPAVVSVTKGGKQGDAVFNPGAQALAVGTATVTLTDSTSEMDAMVYTVTVTE